jgi:FkbM family methyltransferase
MPSNVLQTVLAKLPKSAQFLIRRVHFLYLIRRNGLKPDEPEIVDVQRYVRSGDWVIDVGANIGRYTCFMARCVGESGRVVAIEPIAETFALLTNNVHACVARNVTLLNLGLSSKTEIVRMTVPPHERSKLDNYYQARISSGGDYVVLCVPLDSLSFPQRIRLIKVDAEGHDLQVLQGAEKLIERDRPIIIVEGWENGPVAKWLGDRCYIIQKRSGSANIVGKPQEWADEAVARPPSAEEQSLEDKAALTTLRG